MNIYEVAYQPVDIRDDLIKQSIANKNKISRKEYDELEAKIVYKHHRAHTVYVTPSLARKAKPGSKHRCAYACAWRSLKGIFATLVFRRVAYSLERDERGKLAIFKFGVPDVARYREIKFDRGKGMDEHSIVFRPLPFSRTPIGLKKGKGRRGPNKNMRRKPTRLSRLRVSRIDDI